VVASLQDLKYEMLPPNIQKALANFGISSTGDMQAMYAKYKDSPSMLNMGMQMIGLTPAAVDQIVAQASAKQKAVSASTPASASVVAQAPARAAAPSKPQPQVAARQDAKVAVPPVAQQVEAEVEGEGEEQVEQPEQPVTVAEGEEDVAPQQVDTSVSDADAIIAPAEQEPVGEEDQLPTAVDEAIDPDAAGVDPVTAADGSAAASAISEQDQAIEQLIANGRGAGVSGAVQAGGEAMARKPVPPRGGKTNARGGQKQQAVMDDIVTQMMAEQAMQQQMPQGMPPAGPQPPMPQPPQRRPPPPVAQKSQRTEAMISNLVRGAKGKSDAQSKRGAPTGRR